MTGSIIVLRMSTLLTPCRLHVFRRQFGKALAPTLTTVLTECLPPTLTDVLGCSLADFQSQFGTAGGAESTLQVRKLLEASADLILAITRLL
jgi:hypothetical protein